jgi:hypothetical protein
MSSFGGAGNLGGAGNFGGARPTQLQTPSNLSRPANSSFPAAGGGLQNSSFGHNSGFQKPGLSQNIGAKSSAFGGQSAQSFQRPNQNQLNDFLGMQQGGKSNAFNAGASTLPSGGGSRSYTTAGGSTITVGGKGGTGTTAGGTQVGGAVGGIKVEGSGGQTYVKGVGAIGATDGTNSAIRGGSVTGAQNAAGDRAANVRGGYANSSGYRQGGSVTAVQGKNGYTAVNARGGYGTGNGTGQVGSVTAIRGPGGQTIAAGHGASFVNGQFVGGQTWQAVNGNYTHWNCFHSEWYGRYPNAWWPGKWAVAATVWSTLTWGDASSYCSCEGTGTYYDYGENVTYQDGMVYQGDEPVASTAQYYDQASQIAANGASSENEEWLPLGVFAIVQPGQTNTDKVAQLALNKEGVIKGNLHDVLADSVTPISGSVDKKTQRVALKIQGNDSLIAETGLYNLTNDEVPMLIHFNSEQQETRTLVRLKQPEEAAKP